MNDEADQQLHWNINVPVRCVAEKNAQAWQTQPDLPQTDEAPHQNGQTQI